MKKIRSLTKNPMMLVLIFILIFFTPTALYSPGQSRNVGVVVAVGVDQVQDDYQLSLLTFIPKPNQTFKESNSVVSGRGKTIAQALYNAQVALGRRVGLSHVKITVLSQQLMQKDITGIVDYLSRLASLSSSTLLVGTNGQAKEVLSLSGKMVDEIGLDIEQVVGFNSEKLFVSETSLEDFYKGYYGKEKSSLIGYLPINQGQSENASVESAGQSGGGQSDGQGQASPNQEETVKQPYLLNSGQALLIKDGKAVELLSLQQMNAISILNENSKGQIIPVKDAEIDGQKHNLTYRIREKKVRKTCSFENGVPVFMANIELGMELMEIDGQHQGLQVRSEFSKLTPEIIAKIDNFLSVQFKDVLDILRQNSADVLGVEKLFFSKNRKQYHSYLLTLQSQENFLSGVVFMLNFKIEPN